MNCIKDHPMMQKENTKPFDINTNTQCMIRLKAGSRYSCFPMKKCLLSNGSTRDVQRKNGVSNGNCTNKAINTNKYIDRQIFGFFKRAEFPMPLYNILGALDMSNVGMVIPYIFCCERIRRSQNETYIKNGTMDRNPAVESESQKRTYRHQTGQLRVVQPFRINDDAQSAERSGIKNREDQVSNL